MSVRGMCAVAVCAVVTVVVGAIPASAASARYVALGDSYSAGLGAGGETGACQRSPVAFPALWAAAHPGVASDSLACSGASTDTVLQSQIPALDPAATLVSITVGGNDVGFSSIMTTCALQGGSACSRAVDGAENKARTVLPAALDRTYAAISAQAPHARVVVLSYPEFYQLHVWFCFGLDATSRAKIDEGIGVVDSVIAAAAARRGLSYADVRGAFVGHQLCSGHKWLHAVDFANLSRSYHPSAEGQAQGYLPAFTAAA